MQWHFCSKKKAGLVPVKLEAGSLSDLKERAESDDRIGIPEQLQHWARPGGAEIAELDEGPLLLFRHGRLRFALDPSCHSVHPRV